MENGSDKVHIIASRTSVFLAAGLASFLALNAYAELNLDPIDASCAALVERNITCADTLSDTTVGGSNELSNYSCSSFPEYDQSLPEKVYSFTPQSNGEVNIWVQSSHVDADLYLMADGCDPAACLAASEEPGSDHLSFVATAGTDYYIVVETYDFPGPFDLIIEDNTGGCREDCDNGVDDDFDGAIDCDDADCDGDPVCRIPGIFDDGFEVLR